MNISRTVYPDQPAPTFEAWTANIRNHRIGIQSKLAMIKLLNLVATPIGYRRLPQS